MEAGMATVSKQKQTILLRDLSADHHNKMQTVMEMAGFTVRRVYDEAEAINLASISSATEEDVVCLMIRISGRYERLNEVFEMLKRGFFAYPVLLVIPEGQAQKIRTIQEEISEELDVHFCSANSTLDALTIIAK